MEDRGLRGRTPRSNGSRSQQKKEVRYAKVAVELSVIPAPTAFKPSRDYSDHCTTDFTYFKETLVMINITATKISTALHENFLFEKYREKDYK